jgi:Chain length determinant protein
MTDSQKQISNSDEIDLGVLFSKIGDFFKNLGLGFLRFIALLRRIPIENKVLFIWLILIGIAGGISYSLFLKKKYYSTTMILSSEYLNKRIVDNTIEKLNLLAEEDSKQGLAKILNISDSLAAKIHDFEAEAELIELEVLKEQLRNFQSDKKNDQVIKQVIDRIEIENRHAYEITVRVYNPTVVYDLQKALVNYFKNNEYLKKRVEITKSNLEARKNKLIGESQKLDSLKAVIYENYQNMATQSRQGSNNVILSDKAVTNPIEIFSQDIDLYNQIQAINRSLYLQDDFELVDGFTEFSKPSSEGILRISAYAILIAIGLGYLIVALSRFNTYLDKLT